MEYAFTEKAFDRFDDMMQRYVDTLTGPVDDFWESHILGGRLYEIGANGAAAGFFTLYDEGVTRYISAFYMDEAYLGHAQACFDRVLQEFAVARAYVPTCDELFLSLCMDKQKKVELQAYFFGDTHGGDVASPQFPEECMHPVTEDMLPEMFALTGDFFDFVSVDEFRRGDYTLWQMREGEEILGYGVMVPNKLARRYTPCGEIVLEKHRRRGVARSLQYHMAQMCRRAGRVPIGGCWYYNTPSRDTFLSIGRYSRTRLLNVIF